ncbi:MAG: ATP-binding protein [Deltaproteobacteria bacterium]|nr:ATP-binding protein [Deltaproteobacteria bacterium]
MKIKLKNLGALRQAEFELGEMTIICGANNTGKTYATYALYGFLDYWHRDFSIFVDPEIVNSLFSVGTVTIGLENYVANSEKDLLEASGKYTQILSKVFASREDFFKESSFVVQLPGRNIRADRNFEKIFGSPEKEILKINWKSESELEASLLIDKSKDTAMPRKDVISAVLSDAIKEAVYSQEFPNAFIASAERTGAAIFRKELDFARNRLIDLLKDRTATKQQISLFSQYTSDYALPVKRNVDFMRSLESIAKKDSFISKEHPELLDDFSDILGGEYRILRDELYFTPKINKRLRLTMDESSSSVRSLLDIGFYLRHVAEPKIFSKLREPELNLHPENQRRMARLFARLVNCGIKVFMTTHSDYIVKELNTLIMLNRDIPSHQKIMEDYHYREDELIEANKIRVYIAEKSLMCVDGGIRKTYCQTLVPAKIDQELGIEARTFDTTIDEMNKIQEAIIFSGGDNDSSN